MIRIKGILTVGHCIALMTCSAMAEEAVLYCTVEHIVGMTSVNDDWQPKYTDKSSGTRYVVRFSEDFSKVKGVEGTDTEYNCVHAFHTKAPDVVTCLNSKVVTMVFNYSKETGHFILSVVSPGGWLGVGTDRAEGGFLDDRLVLGQCQDF